MTKKIILLLIIECLSFRESAFAQWRIVGPGGGGKITCITEDPSNPNNLYMTINVGGARKSTDGGKTWQIMNRGFDYAKKGDSAQKMMDIFVHSEGSLLAAGLNGQIYQKSVAGGEWSLSYEHPVKDYDYSRFTRDPQDPNLVYIGVGSIQMLILGCDTRKTGEYWQRIDGGPTIIRGRWNGQNWTWQEVGTITGEGRKGGKCLNIYSIGINPANTKELFFVTERGFYTGSLTNGRITSFATITQGLPNSEYIHGGKIVFEKGTSGVAYLTLLNLDGTKTAGGVFKSLDYGKSWTKLTNGLDDHPNYFDIQIDPKDSNTIYAAQFHLLLDKDWVEGNLYRSTDSGAN
jgi:hypothetical protein